MTDWRQALLKLDAAGTPHVLVTVASSAGSAPREAGAKMVVTADGKTITGIVLTQNEGTLVLADSTGQEIKIDMAEIEEINPSKTSVMPEGLLNSLTLEEIGDLFAFLMNVDEPRVVEFMEDLELR